MKPNKILAFARIRSHSLMLAFLFLLIGFVFIHFINAGIEDNAGNINEKIQGLEDSKGKIETKWEYLGKEWQTIFLKNKYIAGIDNFLKKISFVFLFLFGEPYSLSLTLFLVIIFWVYLFFEISKILSFTAFSKGPSKIIGAGLVLIIAQTHILRKIVEFAGNFIFSKEFWWMRAIIILLIIVFFYISYNLTSLLGKKIKEGKEKMEKEQEKIERKSFSTILKSLFKGLGED